MGPTRVALLAPMPSELKPVVRAFNLGRDDLGGLPLWRGTVATCAVVAGRTGMGTEAARDATRRVLDVVAPEHVLVVGVAGGSGAGLRVGDVVVPEHVVDERTGTVLASHRFGDRPCRGRIVTSDRLLVDPVSRRSHKEGGVDALDMETAAVASVCEEAGLPWSAVRALSDHVDDGLVDDEVFALARPDGSPDLGAVARYLARAPWRVPRLVRLGRDLRTATHAAADEALRLTIEHVTGAAPR